ncbi:MAG: hypothetical protein ACTSVV_04880 [Promethearchaeota archaeon]
MNFRKLLPRLLISVKLSKLRDLATDQSTKSKDIVIFRGKNLMTWGRLILSALRRLGT